MILALILVGCTNHVLKGPKEGPCPGAFVDERADADDPVAGTTAREILEAASGTRDAVLEGDSPFPTDVFTWTFEERRTAILELTGGTSIFGENQYTACPVGPAARIDVRVTLTTEAGFEGQGDGTVWFAEGKTWIGVGGVLDAWPPSMQPVYDGLCGSKPWFGSEGSLGAIDREWELDPRGSFTKVGGNCGQTAFRWQHPI